KTQARPPARPSARGRPVRTVEGWVKRADTGGRGTRIGETQAAVLALDDDEPQAAALRGRVGRFDQRRPVAAVAEQAVGLLPLHDRARDRCGSPQVARKIAHRPCSLIPADTDALLAAELYWPRQTRSIAG